LFLAAAEEVFTGKVTSVADGDSVTVLRHGRPVRVRLYGVDAPELGQDYGPRAQKLAAALADQETVIVRVRDRDRYSRVVGLVEFADGRVLNREMLKAGLAWWYRKYAPGLDEFKDLEKKAREAKLGLWREENPMPPWEWRQWPWCASRNSKVYHPCSCPSVSPEVIRPENLIRFRTEEQAQKSGRRHCRCQK